MKGKSYITKNLLYKNSLDNIKDLFRRYTGNFYNKKEIYGGLIPKMNTFQGLGISVKILPANQNYDEGGTGCFDINDIFYVYPIQMYTKISDPAGATEESQIKDQTGRTLEKFEELLYGLGPEEGYSALTQGNPSDAVGNNKTDIGNIPYSNAGLLKKSFFNTRFYDNSFVLESLDKETSQSEDPTEEKTNPTYKLNSEYNYYIKKYEDYVSLQTTQEASLPFLYNFVDEVVNNDPHLDLKTYGKNKREDFDDPKTKIFLGGKNQPIKIYDTLLYDNGNSFVDIIDFSADSFKDATYYIAYFENNLLNEHVLEGFGSDDDEFEGIDIPDKNISFEKYLLEYTREAHRPSEPLSWWANPGGPANSDYSKQVRKILTDKYKNIIFRGMNLFDYEVKGVPNSIPLLAKGSLFPMSSDITFNIPISNFGNGIDGYGAVFTKDMTDGEILELIIRKFADTTGKSSFLENGKTELGMTHYYDPQVLKPYMLDTNDRFYKNRTEFEVVSWQDGKENLYAGTISAKTIDFIEFISELKRADSDYFEQGGDNYSFTKNYRWVNIGTPLHDIFNYEAKIEHNQAGTENFIDDEIPQQPVENPVQAGGAGKFGFGFIGDENIGDSDKEVIEGMTDPVIPAPIAADYLSQIVYDKVVKIFQNSQLEGPFNETDVSDYSKEHESGWYAGIQTLPAKSYSEILCFRLSKHETDPATGQPKADPIQNIYFPCVKKAYKFVDTQVKYGKTYRYNLHAITLVIGTKYFYKSPTTPSVGMGVIYDQPFQPVFHTTMQLVVEPDVTIVEVPYQILGDVAVHAHPPLSPVVEYITYKKIENNTANIKNYYVDIMLQSPTTYDKLFPIPVEESDYEYYDKVKHAQDLGPSDEGKILFSSLTSNTKELAGYRVYSLTDKPASISDFAESYELYPAHSTSIMARFNMSLNKKYYMMFRSENVHGGVSNPTNIYEVELVSLTDGSSPGTEIAVYPIIKGYALSEFFKGQDPPKRKSFRRYMHIRPSLNQTKISNYDANMYNAKMNFQPEFNSNPEAIHPIVDTKTIENVGLLKRKIKIRLTSKSTGRKIDMNLNFNHTHVPLDVEKPQNNDDVIVEHEAEGPEAPQGD